MTAHDPAERVHVLSGEKSATPLEAHVMVPAGDAPVTVAVQVVREPGTRSEGVQLALTFGVALMAVTANVPDVAGLVESPP